MKKLVLVMAIAFLFALCIKPSWAATDTATATISATITPVTDVTLIRDDNSVTRGSATQVVFNRTDAVDLGSSGSPAFMYAPYRSETQKNWHVAQIIANGSNMVLSASVTGMAGNQDLSSVLRVWCGGFFTPGAKTPISGTETPTTTGWEYLNGWQRSLDRPFIGTAPFNYQLDISSVQAGTYSGTITFTLTSS